MACDGFGFPSTRLRSIFRWFIQPFASSTHSGGLIPLAIIGSTCYFMSPTHCWCCVCRCADETAMVLLCVGFDPLRAGSFVQNNGLHAASGAVPDFVVTEKADQLAKNYSDRPVFPSWAGDGLDHSLVGTIPSGHARSALCPQSDRARPHRQSRGLVLFGQTDLAIQSDLHLSAMEHRADSSALLHVAVGGNGSLRGNLFSAAICWAQRRNRNAVFRSHA